MTGSGYRGTTIALRVLPGSIHNKLGLAIQSPKSDIVRIDLKEASRGSDESSEWKPMQKLLGGVWQFVSGSALQAPISIRLRSSNSSRTMVADAVIPGGWQPGSTYRSLATSESHLV
ncbi:putative expansin-B14 [Camellia sinensis]|uniref:putative expansin-B14 n=1 Tax=Camellia sinensis TaxID=4442 RepID=UPI001035E33E|nr:putative expansin-B14 [Camellia sinensis]